MRAASHVETQRSSIDHDDFKFWFTSRHDSSGLSDSRIEHMTMIEELVEDIKRDHDPANRFTFEFIVAGHFELTI